MKICFVGTSHAAQHLSRAAQEKGFTLCGLDEADIVFVSEDTPTGPGGVRDLETIRGLVAIGNVGKPLVLTSAVPPGFTRSLGLNIVHQAETLRIKDAEERARNPEMLIVGTDKADDPLPNVYWEYLDAFKAPVIRMTWEEAEFTKVAINCCLVSQVTKTNILAHAAAKVEARWSVVASALKMDSRIGKHSYLEPGRWQDSKHLLRDFATLNEILG